MRNRHRAGWRFLLFTVIVTVYRPIWNVIRMQPHLLSEGASRPLPCAAPKVTIAYAWGKGKPFPLFLPPALALISLKCYNNGWYKTAGTSGKRYDFTERVTQLPWNGQ